jgi:hypothetical protein
MPFLSGSSPKQNTAGVRKRRKPKDTYYFGQPWIPRLAPMEGGGNARLAYALWLNVRPSI